MTEETKPTKPYDPLDMSNYRVENLPKMQKTGFEWFLQKIGGPLSIVVFVLLYWCVDLPFIDRIDTNAETTTLTESAMQRY